MSGGRLGVYERVSDKSQFLENQEQDIRRYIEHHGLNVIETYTDHGFCGEIPFANRPAGRRLLQDVQANRINTVLVYSIGRLGREMLDSIGTLKALQNTYGVSFLSIKEPIDTRTPAGMMMMQQFAAWAEFERSTILERTALGMERVAREGKWNGGKAPYGYCFDDDRRLIEDPVVAATVRRIFDLYLSGMSGEAIAHLLNAEGISTPSTARGIAQTSSGHWWGEVVMRLLRNPIYIGAASYRKRKTCRENGVKVGLQSMSEAHHIPIPAPVLIPPDVWQHVQEAILRNPHHSNSAQRDFILTGLLECGVCGSPYVGEVVKRPNGQHFYYRCNRRAHARADCSAAGHLRAEELEERVWSEVTGSLEHPGEVIRRFKESIDSYRQTRLQAEATQSDVERLLKEKQAERAWIIDRAKRGLLTPGEEEEHLARTLAEVAALQQQQQISADIQREAQLAQAQLPREQELLKSIRRLLLGATPEDCKEIYPLLLHRILVKPLPKQGRTPKVSLGYFRRLGGSSTEEMHGPLCVWLVELGIAA